MHLVDIYKEDVITWENICDCHPPKFPIHIKKRLKEKTLEMLKCGFVE